MTQLLRKDFVQKVTLMSTKRSGYGDIVPDFSKPSQVVYCRFRVESTTVRVNNREELRADQAMVWFPPETPIVQNAIIVYENRYWEVVRINEARRMGSTRVEFLKCWVEAHEMVS